MFGLSRRERALKKATGALAEFYQVPHPGPRASLADLPMLAVDVETTGLSPRDDRLLSIGWVPIDGGTITLAGAGHVVLQQRDGTSVGESATIHGLTDDAVRAGMPAAEAVTGLPPWSKVFSRLPALNILALSCTFPSWILLLWNVDTWNAWAPIHVVKT